MVAKNTEQHSSNLPFSENADGSFENRSYRAYYILLFLAFGAIIALLTSAINYRLDIKNTRQEIDIAAKIEVNNKRRELTSYIQSLEDFTKALRDNPLLARYILTPNEENYNTLASLFLAIATTNQTFTQVRFLDSQGFEVLRVDRNAGQSHPNLVPKDLLQNKSHRYYFVEAARVSPNDFWYSRLDLNVENKKIEIPYKPVLRIASPVYVQQQFRGIVIINCVAKRFLNIFRQSSLFDISLIDREGEFLVHHDDRYSWSRYLETGFTLNHGQPEHAEEILQKASSESLSRIGDIYVASVKSLLSQDGAAIVMHPTTAALEELHAEKKRAMFIIIGLIFLLSIPLAMLLSKIPTHLSNRISSQNNVLKEYVTLIDENIITSTGDNNGRITDVSTAFSKICGYPKEALIGNYFKMLRHEDVEEETYSEVTKTILKGQIWQGELKYQKKDGSTYWTLTTIWPKFDSQGMVNSHTAIHHDITPRKILEKISITDELTGLYNRRYFNTIIQRELKRAQRNNRVLTFAMMDVDHFKQYNDHYGHQQGDQVLQAIGKTLKSTLNRGSDFCFRLGGEEFGILFTGLDLEEGLVFGERIRESIENLTIEHRYSNTAPYITLSMGLLSIAPGPSLDVDKIYKMADDAMYTAKAEGRNRVISRLINGS